MSHYRQNIAEILSELKTFLQGIFSVEAGPRLARRLKTIIGILTGSLGILFEALYSGLDLVAAVITYFSVKVSDHPADDDHHYGQSYRSPFSGSRFIFTKNRDIIDRFKIMDIKFPGLGDQK